jgi:hypothetical protein
MEAIHTRRINCNLYTQTIGYFQNLKIGHQYNNEDPKLMFHLFANCILSILNNFRLSVVWELKFEKNIQNRIELNQHIDGLKTVFYKINKITEEYGYRYEIELNNKYSISPERDFEDYLKIISDMKQAKQNFMANNFTGAIETLSSTFRLYLVTVFSVAMDEVIKQNPKKENEIKQILAEFTNKTKDLVNFLNNLS